jgi:L-ascorbate metabolism protein UlaG (beta-lactamase superfamily)
MENPRASVTFIGNATTVLRLGDFTLLTDPNFVPAGNRVHLGYGMWTRRLKDPARSIAQLPPLDAVLLSHFHGDHWDRVATAEVPRTTPIVTTQQAQRALRRRRFEEVRACPPGRPTTGPGAGSACASPRSRAGTAPAS